MLYVRCYFLRLNHSHQGPITLVGEVQMFSDPGKRVVIKKQF